SSRRRHARLVSDWSSDVCSSDLSSASWPKRLLTVRDAVNDAELGPWLERLLFDEVVPVLQGRVEDPAGFARQVLDRFRNPFLERSEERRVGKERRARTRRRS